MTHQRNHDNLWQRVRKLKKVAPEEIIELAFSVRASAASVTLNLDKWTLSGHLEKTDAGYRLVKDSREAPIVRADGTVMVRDSGQQRMWRILQVRGRATISELIMYGSLENNPVSRDGAVTFAKYLEYAGYLRRAARTPKGARFAFERATFILIKNTGPVAPQITRAKEGRGKEVYDRNLRKTVWTTEKGMVEA